MKPSPKTTTQNDERSGQDPDFNDDLEPGMDPEGQDFRDAVDTNEALSRAGVVAGIDAELKEQDRQVEADQLEVLETLRNMDAGETIKWRISRTGTGDPNMDGFLDTWPSALLTLERIRDRMGGGTYYLKGFRNGKYWVHKTVTIAGEPRIYRKDEAGRVMNAPTTPGGSFDVQAFLAQQEARDAKRRQEEEDRRAQERRDREEREEKERARWERMMGIILPTVGTIGSALVTAFAGRQDNTAALIAAVKGPDPLTMLAQMQAMQKSGQSNAVERILPMLIDMAGSRASAGDTGWLDVIKEFAKGAGPALGGMIEAQMAAARAQAAISAQNPSTPAIPSPTTGAPMIPIEVTSVEPSGRIVVPESVSRKERRTRSAREASLVGSPDSRPGMRAPIDPDKSVNTAGSRSLRDGNIPEGSDMNLFALMPHLPWLKEQLARMVTAATKGKDPEVYAALFLEELPDGIDAGTVGLLLASTDWYQKLMQLEPRLNDARIFPWFDRLRGLMLHSLQESLGVTFGEHSPPQPSEDPRAATRVEVKGTPRAIDPDAQLRRLTPNEVERPSGVPDLFKGSV